MNRFALLFVALTLAIQLTGCGGDTVTSSPEAASGAADSEPGEAKAYKAKEAERLAERAEKAARAKSGKPASKGR